eukprot:NODE_183_length_13752_cov_1.079103.p5 type:complete len:242 gc:universal NODE_183_length_13752_cov_1.079103:687-1412(+)
MGSNMSRFTPLNQVKLSNVSIVRLKKGGKRFELACYKNKITDYRNGLDTNLDNILQIDQIFMNVSKGLVANQKDLSIFNKPQDQIIMEILTKGDIQLGELERKDQYSQIEKEIAHWITENTVHPSTNKPYSLGIIEKSIKQVHFSINIHKNTKQQAIEVLKLIQNENVLEITRVQLKVRVTLPHKYKQIYTDIKAFIQIEEESVEDELEVFGSIEPNAYKQIQDMMKQTKGKGRVELVTVK